MLKFVFLFVKLKYKSQMISIIFPGSVEKSKITLVLLHSLFSVIANVTLLQTAIKNLWY